MNTLPTNPPPLPHAGDVGKRHQILVAKRVPPDIMGEDPQYTHPERKAIPVSLMQNRDHGPRRTKQGRIVEHTLLGDAEEFELMETLFGGGKKEEQGRDEEAKKHTFKQKQKTKPLSPDERAAIAESKRRMEDERRRWLSQLHIFQRYREIRQPHALRNWQRHSLQWSSLERTLSKHTSRSPSQLLMSRIGEYREKMEEKTLVETALRLLEEEGVGFWKMGLKVGSDLLGLTMEMPRGGIRELERVRSYDVDDKTRKRKKSNPYQLNRQHENGDIISLFDPFYSHGDSGHLSIHGHNILDPKLQSLAETYLNRLDSQTQPPTPAPAPHSDEPHEQITDKSTQAEPNAKLTGPSLTIATPRLTFQTTLREVSLSILTVYNRGSTACQLEWQKVEKENPLGVKAQNDGIQRFYLSHEKGVILPGTAFDFRVVFKSSNPGIFTETYHLHTIPSTPPLTLTLHGIAVEPDTNVSNRDKLDKYLLRKQAETAAKYVVEEIMKNVKPRAMSARTLRKLEKSRDEVVFVERNKEIGIYYYPQTLAKLRVLAHETYSILSPTTEPPKWDMDIKALYDLITQVEDLGTRSMLLRRLNEYVKEACSARSVPGGAWLLKVIGTDIFSSLADKISSLSLEIRKRMDLTLDRPQIIFFPTPDANQPSTDSPPSATTTTTSLAPPATPDPRRPTPPSQEAKKPAKKGSTVSTPAKGKAAKEDKDKGSKEDKNVGKKVELKEPDHHPTTPRHPLQLSKLTIRPKRPDPAQTYTPERRALENKYRNEFRRAVRGVVEEALVRLCGLWEDVEVVAGVEREE